MKANFIKLLLVVASVIVGFSHVSAHVVVKPNEVEPGAFQTFTMGVPVEKDSPTIGLRLLIPAGLHYVTPTVKPGWKITTKKEGDAITEILWTGGSIPTGERDEFGFSAQVPSTEQALSWKAYQTYQNGTIVAWDQDPSTTKDSGGNPFSVTQIKQKATTSPSVGRDSSTFTFSIVALVFSIIAISLARKNRVIEQ